MDGQDTAGQKIKSLDELARITADLRRQGKKIVHCHGVFDLLHIGHVRHFQKARQQGDCLVVTLTPDHWVNKGPHRPAFMQQLRAEMLASLRFIDYVAINQWPSAVETIHLLRPHIFAKGCEFAGGKDVTGHVQVEEVAIRAIGGEMLYTEDITFSSTSLLNQHFPLLSKEASDFLLGMGKRYAVDDILNYVEGARGLKTLVIGETIIDEYHYCETLGKAGKEPILAVRYRNCDKFAGGILAVANHVANFCDQVDLISALGDVDSQEEFIRARLNPKVNPFFLHMGDAPTIVKRRFLESYPFQKMFEVYVMNDDKNEAENTDRLLEHLERKVDEYDLVIVTDYGHGLMVPRLIDFLAGKARCLAVNTQANAGNHGFNTISKYPRVDYICVSENEIRLEARQRQLDVKRIVVDVADRLGCNKVMITRGRQGMLCYFRDDGFCEAPPFCSQFTDRVGAGDAVFAVTSLCMALGAPADVLGLIGNAVGSMKIKTVGNGTAIDRVGLIRYLTSLIKVAPDNHQAALPHKAASTGLAA